MGQLESDMQGEKIITFFQSLSISVIMIYDFERAFHILCNFLQKSSRANNFQMMFILRQLPLGIRKANWLFWIQGRSWTAWLSTWMTSLTTQPPPQRTPSGWRARVHSGMWASSSGKALISAQTLTPPLLVGQIGKYYLIFFNSWGRPLP